MTASQAAITIKKENCFPNNREAAKAARKAIAISTADFNRSKRKGTDKHLTISLKSPFVFARLSCIRNKTFFKKLLNPFVHSKIFIPRYILENYARSRQISPKDIQNYLKEIIYYKIAYKEKKALKLFLKKEKQSGKNRSVSL